MLKRGRERRRQFFYEKRIKNERDQKHAAKSDVNQLDKIKDSPDLDQLQISAAFKDELRKGHPFSSSHDEAAFNFVEKSFNHVLSHLADRVDPSHREMKIMSPQEAARQFLTFLQDHLFHHNQQILKFDRKGFKDILERLASEAPFKDSFYQRISGLCEHQDDEEFKELIQDYTNGVWKEGEEKRFNYAIMDPSMYTKMRSLLVNIIGTENFKELLINYFTQVKDQGLRSSFKKINVSLFRRFMTRKKTRFSHLAR